MTWDHNDHFHPWVLRHLGAAQGPVLDVGCGVGALIAAMRARGLAPVVGIDPDELMAHTAQHRFAGDNGVTIHRASFFDLSRGAGPVPREGVGGITMVSSLHHLAHQRGLEASLGQARALLAPGGRLVVVGMARPSVPADYAVDAVSVLLDPVVGALKAARGRFAPAATVRPVPAPHGGDDTRPTPAVDTERSGTGMPVRDPDETFTEVVRTAASVLPGARMRRRLWFRYSLEWTAPA